MAICDSSTGTVPETQENAVIEVGSTWEFEDGVEVPKDEQRTFVIDNVRVMGDGTVEVTISYDGCTDEVVTLTDIRERENDGTIARTNDSHEAWEVRESR